MNNINNLIKQASKKQELDLNYRWNRHLNTNYLGNYTSGLLSGFNDIGRFAYDTANTVLPYSKLLNNKVASYNDITNNSIDFYKNQLNYGNIGSYSSSDAEFAKTIPSLIATSVSPSVLEASIASKASSLASKLLLLSGKSVEEGTKFTLLNPSDFADNNKNMYNMSNKNLSKFKDSVIANSLMIGAPEIAIKSSLKIAPKAYKNINNIIKDKTKDNIKTIEKDEIKEARLHKDVTPDNANIFNSSKNYNDIDLIDKNKLEKNKNKIFEDLHNGEIIELNNLINDDIKHKLDKHLMIEYPDSTNSGAFVVPKDIYHPETSDFIKYLEDEYALTEDEAINFVENNNIVAVGEDFKKLDAYKQKSILEHELSHIINKKIHGDEEDIGINYDNASSDLHDAFINDKSTLNEEVSNILSNDSKKSYYLNESEATAQIGSLIDNINKNGTIHSGIDKFKQNELNAINLYTKLATDKDWKKMSKDELIQTLNKAQDKLDKIYKENRIQTIDEFVKNNNIRLNAIDNTVIDPIVDKMKKIQKNDNSNIDLSDIIDDIEFAKIDKHEHIKNIQKLHDIVKKTQEKYREDNNINTLKELNNKINYYNNYLLRLLDVVDFSDNERLTKLNKKYDKITRKLDNFITENTETKYTRLNNKTLTTVKKIDTYAKNKHQINTITQAKKILYELDSIFKEQYKFLKAIFKNDKIYDEYIKDFINKKIEQANTRILHNKLYIGDIKDDLSIKDLQEHFNGKNQLDNIKYQNNKNNKYNKEKVNNNKKNIKNKDETNTKNDKINNKEKNRQKHIDVSKPQKQHISLEYLKRKIRSVDLKLKQNSKKILNIPLKNIKRIGSNKHYLSSAQGFMIDDNVFMSEFFRDANNKTHKGFETELEILFHELAHIAVKNNKNLSNAIKNLNELPKYIKKYYDDTSYNMQKEEAYTHYVSKRFLYDFLSNSAYKDFINKDFLYNLKKDYLNLETKEIKKLYNDYKNTMIYEIKNNKNGIIYKYINPSIIDTIYGKIDKADTIASNYINIAINKTLSISKKYTPNIVRKLLDSKPIREIINDYKIGQDHNEIYSNIRDIFNKKHKLLTKIKNSSNTLVNMIKNSETYKNINNKQKANEFFTHIHKLNNIFDYIFDNIDRNNISIKSYYKSIIDNIKYTYNEKIINDLFTKKFFNDIKLKQEFNKIIETSCDPMSGGKYYLKNEFQIFNWLIRNKLVNKNTKYKDYILNYINLLLDKKYIEKYNLLDNEISSINIDKNLLSAISFVKSKEKYILGEDYIRGYIAFTPKRKIETAINIQENIFKKEDGWIRYKNTPIYYRIDLRNDLSNNLLEYNQIDTTGHTIFVKNDKQAQLLYNNLKKNNIDSSFEYDNNGKITKLRIYFDKDFDKNILEVSTDYIENLASQYTSLALSEANIKLANQISKDLKELFSEKPKKDFEKLSSEEISIFKNAGLDIKYIKKDFKNLIMSQQEFLFSKENMRILRYFEKTYKNIIKNFRSNVTVYNIKSIANNLFVIPSILLQHNIKISTIAKTIKKTIQDYKEFNTIMTKLKKNIIILQENKNTISDTTIKNISKNIINQIEYLKNNNVFYNLHELGSIQTLADDYLMSVSNKKSEIVSLIELILNKHNNKIDFKNISDFNIILDFFNQIENLSIKGMNFADLVGRGSLYRELLAQGKSSKEAARITNETFVDFRRTYPKFINELDNYGLPFIGFMYRNSYMLAKTMKDRPITTLNILATLYLLHKIGGNNNDDYIGNIRTASWEYQNSFIDNKFINGSLITHLLSGDFKEQMLIPNNAIIIERVITGKESPIGLLGITKKKEKD